MTTYQPLRLEEMFPSSNTFSSWLTNKYTIIGLIVLFLLFIALIEWNAKRKTDERLADASVAKKLAKK